MADEKLKKVTFALPESMLARLRYLVESNRIASQNSAVREAVEEYLTKLESEEFACLMAEAARDPEFIRDIKETDKSFCAADANKARTIAPW